MWRPCDYCLPVAHAENPGEEEVTRSWKKIQRCQDPQEVAQVRTTAGCTRGEERNCANEKGSLAFHPPQPSDTAFRSERWLLVSSVGISPRSQLVMPCPTPSCKSVAAAEPSTAMLMIVALLWPPGMASSLPLAGPVI